MLDPLIRNEILLEIALSLSGENQLSALLQRSLPVFMSKLNCAIASVVRWRADGEPNTVMVIPRIMQNRPAYQRLLAEMAECAGASPAVAPFTLMQNNLFYYGFLLNDFGLLILGRNAELDPILLHELAPVVAMLGRSCLACLEYEQRRASESALHRQREQLRYLTEGLAHLSADNHSSINQLTQLAGEALDADCAIYYRLEQGLAVARGQWRMPREEPQVMRPEERLCYQVLQGRERFQYFRPATPLSGEAPVVGSPPCGWQTCLSSGVYHHARCVGALCLRFPNGSTLIEEYRFVVDLITQGLQREEALNRMQENLTARLRCEIGLAQFASTLIQAPESENSLRTALQQLLDATDADRLYLFENFTNPVDGLCCRQTHEVCRLGVTTQLSNPLLQYIPYSTVPLFHQDLAQRRTVNRIVAQLPATERELLTSQGILSVLVIPVFMDDEWRGFMGFDDTRQEREWSEQEIRLLQTAVDIYQLYRQRQDRDVALRQSEIRHRNLYRLMRLVCDTTQDMIWAKDIQRNYLFANQALCTQLLVTVDPDEAVGKSDLFFAERETCAHPEQPNWMTLGATCRESDARVMHEARSLHNEESGYVRGQWRVLDVIKSPLLDEQGQLIGTVGCARDITEAKQSQQEREAAQQQLFENENLLNLIIEAIPNPVFYKNADFRYERCNQAYANFLGVPKPQLIGALVHDVFPRDLADVYRRADLLLQQTGGQQIYEAQLMHADGSRHDVIFYKSLILNADGASRGIVGVVVDITQHKQTEAQLRHIAETDALTQTYNRAYFCTVMEREFDRARRYQRRLSLIMLDLDHFKTINDTYGHDVGDRVLQEIATLIRRVIRKHDILVRWGGEEFVVLCVETPISEAYNLSKRLLEDLRQRIFPAVGQITASFGVVEYQDDESTKQLFKRLDTALYAAKTKGRNRIECMV